MGVTRSLRHKDASLSSLSTPEGRKCVSENASEEGTRVHRSHSEGDCTPLASLRTYKGRGETSTFREEGQGYVSSLPRSNHARVQ